MQSTGCKGTTTELLTKYFEGIWEILGSFQSPADLKTQPCMVLKFRKIPDTSAVKFGFTETFYLLLKRYLPLVHKIDFANKFQLNCKIK